VISHTLDDSGIPNFVEGKFVSKATYTFVALGLLVLSGTAGAFTVRLEAHNQRSSSGTLSTLKWAGPASSASWTCATFTTTNPCINPANANLAAMGITPSTAVWDWDPVTGILSMTGEFNTASTLSSSGASAASAVIGDKVVDMVINTTAQETTAASYNCAEGNFLAGVGAHGCANVGTGLDFVYDGSVAYNVGGIATCVNRTVGGDDESTGNPRGLMSLPAASGCDETDGAFNLWTVVTDTTTAAGRTLILSNGVDTGLAGTNYLTFTAVPDAADDAAQGFQETPLVVDVLANDNAFTDPVSLTATDGTNGTVLVTGAPGNQAGIVVTYTPNAGFNGTDTFTYTVTSGSDSDTATVTVTIAALGANDDTATTRLNTAVTISVLTNDVGFADPVTVTSANGTNGNVTVNGSPGNKAGITLTYTPADGFTGTDTFDYTISDGIAPDDTATVTVTVTNEEPTAGTGTITISTLGQAPETRTGTFNAATGNNLGDAPSVVTATDPANGTVTISGTTVTYTPDATFFAGSDTFDYTITDDDDETATNTVTVTIADVTPVVGDDLNTSGSANTTLNGSAAFTAGNGSVAQHTLAVQTQAGSGTCAATVSGNNIAVAYTPSADFAGNDSCVVRLTDGDGSFDDGNFSFTVNAAPGGGGGTGGLLPGGSGAVDPWSLALLASLPLLARRRASRRRSAAGNQ